METEKLSPEIEAKLLELEVLSELMESLNSYPNLTFLSNEILQKAVSTLNGSCGIFFASIHKSTILAPVSTFMIDTDVLKREMLTKNHRAFQMCLQNNKTSVINDFSDSKFAKIFPQKKHFILAPVSNKNELFGFLLIADKETRKGITGFSESDKFTLTAFANQAAVALRSANLFKQISDEKKYNESILGSIQTAVISFDDFGEVTEANKSACNLLGKKQSDLIGRHFQLIFSKDDHIISLIEKVASKKIPEMHSNIMCLSISPDTTVDLSVSPLINNVNETTGVVVTLQDISKEAKIKNTFKRYVSDHVVEQLLNDDTKLKLGGERKDITVLFSDLRGFTSMSEKMTPEEVVTTLNEYFTEMIGIIFRNGGTLDKIVGDELMAVFGTPISAPDDTIRAVKAAIEMRDKLKEFNSGRDKKGFTELKMGIGINSGIAVSGNIGSPERMDFTVIGDTVNLGARLCSHAKHDEIIISSSVYGKIKTQFAIESLEPIQVKGKEKLVDVWNVTGSNSNQKTT